MLTAAFPLAVLNAQLLPRDQYQPFPPAADRAAWTFEEPLQQERKDWLVEQAEAVITEPWPLLPATFYMDFSRNGDRSRYEDPYFQRRIRLGKLVLAECLEYEGRWLDEIVNGLFLLLGEVTWCVPAHTGNSATDPLPGPNSHLVDLFNCETAYVVAETLYLLRSELTAISPGLVQRLLQAVEERIFLPVETRSDEIWWFNGHNNWTPWCSSNTLGAACYLMDDNERLAKLAALLNTAVDRFIDNYGDDGGCDEGPMYWDRAAGAMFDYFTRLEGRLNVEFPLFAEPKIRAMGEFFCTAHLHEQWMLNFADAGARGKGRPCLVHAFGRRVGSETMQQLALATAADFGEELDPRFAGGTGQFLHTGLCTLFRLPTEETPTAPRKQLAVWLPDIQVAVVREHAETGRGLILGAKGGHNAESHNHNDIGHFMVLLDGQPCIVDVGTMRYTSQTFSDRRYELWTTRGSGHNAPVIGGIEQHVGHEFAARDAQFSDQDEIATLSLEIAPAYPPEAGLASLRRQFVFDRLQSQLTITDSIAFRDQPADVELTFYSPQAINASNGDVTIGPLSLHLDAPWQTEVTPIEIEDRNLMQAWGSRLYRLRLTASPTQANWTYSLRLRRT